MDVHKILVPIDFSSDAQRALQWGASLAEKYGAKVVLLHVIPKAVEEMHRQGEGFVSPTSSSYEGIYEGMVLRSQPFAKQPIIIDLEDQTRRELHDFASQQIKEGVPLQVKVAVGRPAAEILRVAGEETVELIVMGTHGRTGLRHLLLGSVAEEVSRHAPCPVFTVRASANVTP